ncbi:zinc ribbon domain-containing protein [Streptomyces sp. CA-210063]|uniref:zinc ribbon domain-containing protein n=1 Tax=Streptomyces sp. CA-210063 TaxID=2801029 RepID=UPI00214AF490|nr:zinc ribbon domain-containing protein [Streptomyces sp. CA-210063]UUU32026.1 zinc ribbon domain-containing protein [Streptomyces sp. CA-210063]
MTEEELMARLYGFEDQARTRLKSDEVSPLREAVTRLFAGQKKPDVIRWMNAAGHLTTRGSQWQTASFDRVIYHPAIAGLAEDPETGELVETGLPHIIEPEEGRRLHAERPEVREREARYDYAFSYGLCDCGECTASLTGARANSSTPGYRCSGCGKVRVAAGLLEDYVGTYVVAQLSRPGARKALLDELERVKKLLPQLRLELGRAQFAVKDLDAQHDNGLIDDAEHDDETAEAKERVKQARARLRFAEQVATAPVESVEDLVQWWNHAPAASKGAVAGLLLKRVTVFKASAQGIRHIEDGRVRLEWRTTAD